MSKGHAYNFLEILVDILNLTNIQLQNRPKKINILKQVQVKEYLEKVEKEKFKIQIHFFVLI